MAAERIRWKKKADFILVCLGAAVGLGNTWRFPYLCRKNGGGTFVICYLVMMALVGMPMYFLELSVGQFASVGPLTVWKFSILFKGLGFTMITSGAVISCYYNVIVAWSLYSLYLSFTFSLPWMECGNDWNTHRCATPNEFNTNETLVIKNNWTMSKSEMKTPIEEYFYRKVLQMSDGFEEIGIVVWQLALCLSISWLIIFLALIKGISNLGKVAYFTSIFPYIMLTVMLIRGVTLEGAREGILFYIIPDWSRIKDAKVWIDAVIQVFISLGTCTGSLIAIASYNDFHNNCFRDAIILTTINCATSLYGGFAVFSILGHLAWRKNTSVLEVTTTDLGLIFIIYPECLDVLPVTPLWSCLFYLTMVSLGLGSTLSMTECFFSAFTDEFPTLRHPQKKRIAFIFAVCFIFCLLSLPLISNGGFYLLHLVDSSICGFPLLVVGLLEILSLNYVYGYDKLSEDIQLMLGHKPSVYYRITWMVVSPLAILILTILMAMNHEPLSLFFGNYLYPLQSEIMVWLIVGLPLLLLPSFGIFHYCRRGGCQVLKITSSPTDDWGPSMDENRSGRYQTKVEPTHTKANKIRKTSAKESFSRQQSKASIVRDAIFNGDVNLAVVVATDNGVVTTDEVYDMVVKGNVNQGYQGDGFKVVQRPDESDDEASAEENPGDAAENPDVEDPDVADPDIEDPDIENPKIRVISQRDQIHEDGAAPHPLARSKYTESSRDTTL